MKLTLANIKEIKRNSSSPLTKRVCNYVIGEWSDYSDKKSIFTDVLYHGCQSGIVGELIYHTDTVKFYKQYRQEINNLLYDTMNGTGLYAPSELFGDKWDKEDPLAPYGTLRLFLHRWRFRCPTLGSLLSFPKRDCFFAIRKRRSDKIKKVI